MLGRCAVDVERPTSRIFPAGLSCKICTSQFAGGAEPSEPSSELLSELLFWKTRIVVTPIAFPTLNRGRDGATGVLSEVGIPPKRSGARCESDGVAMAEGLAAAAGWPPEAASSGAGAASAACTDGAAGAVSAGGNCLAEVRAAAASVQTPPPPRIRKARNIRQSCPPAAAQDQYPRPRSAGKRCPRFAGAAGRQQRARHLRESLAFAKVSYKIAANRDGFWE